MKGSDICFIMISNKCYS